MAFLIDIDVQANQGCTEMQISVSSRDGLPLTAQDIIDAVGDVFISRGEDIFTVDRSTLQ